MNERKPKVMTFILRAGSCDFVDRILPRDGRSTKSHETTRKTPLGRVNSGARQQIWCWL